MRIFWNYKSPEVYELVNLAPERGREKEGRERSKEEGKRETGRGEGGERKKQRQQQRRFQSALSQRESRHSHSNFYSSQTTFLDIFGFSTSAQLQQLNKSENTSPVHGKQTRDTAEEPNIFCFGQIIAISFYLKEL